MQKVRFYREPKPALKIAELFIKKGIKKMKTTIKELMKYEADVDVYNNITDDEAICLCCPLELTEEGLKEWGDVLDYIVETTTDGDYSYAICFCDDDPNVKWQTKKKRLTNFLWSAAGYCSDKDYNKWFMD